MRLHVQLAPGPRPLFPAPPPLPSCTLFPTKKKTLFSFGSHFRSFCVVHFTFHSVHSECVSHPLVRVLRGYFAKLLRHYFPCVSVCVFFLLLFPAPRKIYICIYIFFLFGLCPFGTFRNYFVASRRAACDTCCVAAMCLHSAGNAVVIFLMGPDPRDSPSHPLKQHKKKIWDCIFIADFKTTEILGASPEMGDEPCKQSARKVQEIQFLCAKNKRQEGVTQTPKDIGLNIAWPKRKKKTRRRKT